MTALAWFICGIAASFAILTLGIGIGASIRFGNPTPETPLPEPRPIRTVKMRGEFADTEV